MKDKTSAALLAFFLGGFGAHKFYLGQTGAGVVYLLFCWTFIPAFVAFIEFILLLTMSEEAFNLRFNHYGGATQHIIIQHAPPGSAAFHAASTLPGGAASPPPSVADELKKLHDLHIAGVLTKEEFIAHKQRLLG